MDISDDDFHKYDIIELANCLVESLLILHVGQFHLQSPVISSFSLKVLSMSYTN